MSNFQYDESAEKTGGSYLKAGHFYRGKIVGYEEKNGWANLYLESEGGETHKASSLSQKLGTDKTTKFISKWAYAVVCSNTPKDSDVRAKALEEIRKGFNPETWVEKQYKIGFTCEEDYSNAKFARPAWAEDYNFAENATCTNEAEFKKWEAKSRSMPNTSNTSTGFGDSTPHNTGGLPTEDELPF